MTSLSARPCLARTSRLATASRRTLRLAPPPARAMMSGGDAPKQAPPAMKRWPEQAAPTGVPLPPVPPTKKKPLFGFVDNAEVMNSRAAMIGFFALILLEAVVGKGILEMLGVETGNGIDLGF